MASFSDQLEKRERPGLEDIADSFSSGFSGPFDALEGRIIRGEGAPDPADYAEESEYLRECWQYGLGEIDTAIDELQEAVSQLEINTDSQPDPFGSSGMKIDEDIFTVLDCVDELVGARKVFEMVEGEIYR